MPLKYAIRKIIRQRRLVATLRQEAKDYERELFLANFRNGMYLANLQESEQTMSRFMQNYNELDSADRHRTLRDFYGKVRERRNYTRTLINIFKKAN